MSESVLEMVPKVSISTDEQELVINSSPADGKTIDVYVNYQKWLKRLWKLYEQHPDEIKIVKDDKYGTEFSIPEEWLVIKPKRKVSEEQRAALAQRLANLRADKEECLDDEDTQDS